jgi:TRAP-type mannitol/chloroaromatic compound transport system substrate-binding protein
MKSGAALPLAVLLMLPCPARTAAAGSVTLVTPLAYGTHMPGLGAPALQLARLLKERSGGALQLELKQPGDGTNPQEILAKVGEGKVDAGFAPARLWAASIPAAPLFSGFPFGPDARTYLDWFDRGNGRRLYQEMYDHAGAKVHVLPCAFGGGETAGWFAKEIRSRDDLKGLRMRIFGLGARVMSKLGAVPVLLAGGEIERAFKKGKIDAAELYTPAADEEIGLQKSVKLIYLPGWHQPETVLELLVNQERWQGLSDEQRNLLEGACNDLLQETLGESARLQAEALSEFRAKDGVKVETLPKDVLSALRDAWAEVAAEESAADYFFKSVLDDIETFRNKAPDPPAPAAP